LRAGGFLFRLFHRLASGRDPCIIVGRRSAAAAASF
jgi:hypothetical protein